jgi:hypothetical protein
MVVSMDFQENIDVFVIIFVMIALILIIQSLNIV